MLLAVARRAAGVAHDHGVARLGVDLRLVEQAAGVGRVRAPVNVEQHRMRSVAFRNDHPAVHGIPVAARDRELAGFPDPLLAQRTGEVREPMCSALPEQHQFAVRAGVRDHGDQHIPRNGFGADHRGVVGEAAQLARGRDLRQDGCSPAPIAHQHGVVARRHDVGLRQVDRFRVREAPRRLARSVDNVQGAVPAHEVATARPHVLGGEVQEPVQAVAQRQHREVAVLDRQVPRLPRAVDRHSEDAGPQILVAGRVPGRDEGDRAAVRCVRDAVIVPVARGQLRRFGEDRSRRQFTVGLRHRGDRGLPPDIRHRDREDVRAPVVGVPEPVALIFQGADLSRRFGRGFNPVYRSVAPLLGHAAHERQGAAVGRPDELRDAELAVRDLKRLASGRVDHEELGGRLGPGPQEGEQAPVRRERGSRVAEAPREPPGGCVSGQRNGPELTDRRIRLEGGMADRDHGTAAAGMHRGSSDRGQQSQVGGLHSATGVKSDTSPTRRVWSSGMGSTTACAISAANSPTL